MRACSPTLWVAAAVIGLGVFGCDSAGPSGPSPGDPFSDTATFSGRLTTGEATAGQLNMASRRLFLAGDDDFIGSHSLTEVQVIVLDKNGDPVFSTATDEGGEFSGELPGGDYTVVLKLDDETEFTVALTVPEGSGLYVNGKIDTDPSGKLTLNVEIVRDEDGDGSADDTFAIRVKGRLAGQPGSGQVTITDAHAENGDGNSGNRDLFADQRVRVEGSWDGDEFVASRVAGNCGQSGQPLELVGAIEAKDDVSITVLGRLVGIDDATRYSGRARSLDDLEVDDRVVVRVEVDGEDLRAVRITENGRAHGLDEIVGVIEEISEDQMMLKVLSVDVTVDESARVTSGNGCFGDGDGEDADSDSATVSDLEESQLVVVAQGSFDGDDLVVDHVVVSSSSDRQSAQVFGTVEGVDSGAGTLDVMGATFTLAPNAKIAGQFASLDMIGVGMRVKLTLDPQGDGTWLVDKLNVIGGNGPDMVQGGEISDLNEADMTFSVLGISVRATDQTKITGNG